ncbi:MAG: hypothetical protein ACOCQQ_01595, partial [Candidatus Nanoarchaeia archaeon]
MKLMRIIVIFAVMMLFATTLSALVSASSASIQPQSEDSNFIYFEQAAKFSLTITNTRSVDQVYNINANPVDWLIEGVSSVRVGAGETKTFDLNIRAKPSNYKSPGFYGVPVTLSSAQDRLETQTTIYIRSIGDGSYQPAISLSITMDSEVDPRESVPVVLNFRNRNILDIEELEILISSDHFSLEETTTLNGLEEKSLEFWFDIDSVTDPGEFELETELFYEGKRVAQASKMYEIQAYSLIERVVLQEDTVFFKTTKVSQLTNNANIVKTISSEIDVPFFERLFTTITVKANEVEKLGPLNWDITLQPQEQVLITVTQNYRPIPLFLFLALIAFILYMKLRTPIVLKKHAIVTGKDNEGVSDMRVRVFIRNRTGKSFYNVRVLDKVPTIANVHINEGLGVLQPSDVVRTKHKGTLIKWD